MQAIIDVTLRGLTEIQAALGSLSPAVQNRLRPFMAQATIALREAVKRNIADRFSSIGPLYNSVQSTLTERPGEIQGVVFTQGVPYAKIQEEGGTTRAHVIVPVRAQALAFQMNGSTVFARRVNHPGSRITGRHYASDALLAQRIPFEDGIRAVVSNAIVDTGLRMAAE